MPYLVVEFNRLQLVRRLTFRFLIIGVFAGLLAGCDQEDRVAKLEKQVKDMQADKDRVAEYDLQAKCAKDAKSWFNENWSRDKDTILLDFSNHYNKKENKCFVAVEHHYGSSLVGIDGNSWTNDMTLWNIYENSKYGDFAETHTTYYKPKFSVENEVIICDMLGTKCKTKDEFVNLMRPYLND